MMDQVVEEERPERRRAGHREDGLSTPLEAPGNHEFGVAWGSRYCVPRPGHVLIQPGHQLFAALEPVGLIGGTFGRGGIERIRAENQGHKPWQISDMTRKLPQRARLGMR